LYLLELHGVAPGQFEDTARGQKMLAKRKLLAEAEDVDSEEPLIPPSSPPTPRLHLVSQQSK
jgi:hypothetical protein